LPKEAWEKFDLPPAEWYDIHYLTLCSGAFTTSGAKNRSSTVCHVQNPGSSFLGKVDTIAPFILLVIGIAFTAIIIMTFAVAISSLRRIQHRGIGLLRKQDLPLISLRIGFILLILTVNVFSQSSARITGTAVSKTKHFNVEDIRLPAHTTAGFLALTWIATGFIWIGLLWGIVGAMKVAKMVKGERLGCGKGKRNDEARSESEATLVGSEMVGK
jgi:hypothetical protein